MDYSSPGSSVHGILQTRKLEGLPYSPPGILPDSGIEHKSLMFLALAGVFFTTSATWEAPYHIISSVQSLSPIPTLYNPMDCSTPGFPVHHQLLELAQTHVPQVSDNHPTISSSVDPFSSCLQSFPASESFLISQFFASGGQSLGASASASVLPMNIQ